MTQSPLQPTLGELVATITTQLSNLVKGEVDLLKAQVAEKGQKFGIGAGLFAGAAFFGFFAFATLVATAVLALALVLPAWAAALIVAVVLLLIAGLLAFIGKKSIDAGNEVKPEIKDNLKTDVDVIKDGIKEGLGK